MIRTSTPQVPRPGMFATVRNRRGVIAGVEPFDGEGGRSHLVQIEYKDDQLPIEEQLLWEREPHKLLLEPNALPEPASPPNPMPADDFDALLRAARWTAAMPFLDPDGSGPLERLPIRSPFHGAVEIDDYQLVPLLKALRMPRVNLLIADDVGLGKTVEAGLILSELLIRRRIQRVLILTPASLRLQWRDEMWDKFSLPFDLVDRAETNALRRRLGMDANPWRTFSRTIASYHYLRQPDVLDQFISACRTPEGSPHLPWDLLIVDECHNLMPSPFGEDSDLTKMLRLLAPRFEHRLFLSATPHNGHTRSFTGLLELLDPVRFSQTDNLKPAERSRIKQVVIRRLKREINTRTDPPRFCTRLEPHALVLDLSSEEEALAEAFSEFRSTMRSWIAAGDRKRRRAGSFAVEILGKRLLSCPVSFAESWRRCREGIEEATEVSETDVNAAQKSIEKETGDDRETQSRESVAAGVIGAWLKKAAPHIEPQIEAIDLALVRLGLSNADSSVSSTNITERAASSTADLDPNTDARFDALTELIERLLLSDGDGWRDDERLIIFTEYKTTLDYLARRLRERYEPERILTLYGGMDEHERDLVKRAFNDPAEPVRILLGTDAAAEGLNLQRTARYLLHFDCPWNPSRLEQRNGRLDRHGQARDVQIFHFATDQDDDLKFLAHVIHKANDIREDLGSANELFDEAAHRRLVDGESVAQVQADLDERIHRVRGRAAIEGDDTIETDIEGVAAATQLEALAAELDHDIDSLRETLEAAMAIRAGRPQLVPALEPGIWRLVHPDLAGWAEIVDESLRVSGDRGSRSRSDAHRSSSSGRHPGYGAVAHLAFSPEPFIENIGGRTVFNPRPDVALMHLSHPMFERAFAAMTRRRFPGTGEEVSRWTARIGQMSDDTEALVLLSIEELAINELRETFHHWVRTVVFPVRNGHLDEPLPHEAARCLRADTSVSDPAAIELAADIFQDTLPDLKAFITTHGAALSGTLREELIKAGEKAKDDEEKRYRSRAGEVTKLIAETTLAKLEREIAELKAKKAQGVIWDEQARFEEIDRSIEEKQGEIERRKRQYEEVREQLERERERVVKQLLPKRHSMPGQAQVFPVTVEIRLPTHEGER